MGEHVIDPLPEDATNVIPHLFALYRHEGGSPLPSVLAWGMELPDGSATEVAARGDGQVWLTENTEVLTLRFRRLHGCDLAWLDDVAGDDMSDEDGDPTADPATDPATDRADGDPDDGPDWASRQNNG